MLMELTILRVQSMRIWGDNPKFWKDFEIACTKVRVSSVVAWRDRLCLARAAHAASLLVIAPHALSRYLVVEGEPPTIDHIRYF